MIKHLGTVSNKKFGCKKNPKLSVLHEKTYNTKPYSIFSMLFLTIFLYFPILYDSGSQPGCLVKALKLSPISEVDDFLLVNFS